MAALATYAHSLGLLFGLYSDAGVLTCAGRPGSLFHERSDADSYASWKVDYLKFDNCFNLDIPPRTRYPIMRDALNATGRSILYSLCEWGEDDPATWAASVGNSWRTTGDIKDFWTSVLLILDDQVSITQYAAPGGFNDMDMLEVGNGGMTLVEYQSHFSLWSLLKSPLIIGTDVIQMDPDIFAILSNPEVIAVNQDPLGVSGRLISTSNFSSSEGEVCIAQVWGGPLAGGDFAAVLFNRCNSTVQNVVANFAQMGIAQEQDVRDLWARKQVGSYSGSFSAQVQPHGVVMIRLTPSSSSQKKKKKQQGPKISFNRQ